MAIESSIANLGAAGWVPSNVLLNAVTSIGLGPVCKGLGGNRSFRLKVTGTGSVQATADLYGNNEPSNTTGVFLGTLAANGTNSAQDGGIIASFSYFYANLTSITGTGAAATVDQGPA